MRQEKRETDWFAREEERHIEERLVKRQGLRGKKRVEEAWKER